MLPDDPHRPLFHYAAPTGWLNDPNGLLFLDGEYHLFYQYHPAANVWGPMHWGHAVSRDLLQWVDLPIALLPDANGMIFSGSAVLDRLDTAGFGADTMVAVFTQHTETRQAQSLAYSHDRGRTWQVYADNPVLLPPEDTPDFRDPKVFWFGDRSDGHWVMLLAVGRSVWFYVSNDLRHWTRSDTFGERGMRAGVWECPELIELTVDGGPETVWALIVSVQQGAPAGGSGVQYFLGDFDGQRFTPHEAADAVRWADYGADFYAAQGWNDAPDGQRRWLAWMNNWDYAHHTPASHWRGVMSLARELTLSQIGGALRLVQRPVGVPAAGWTVAGEWRDLRVAPGANPLAAVQADAAVISLRVAVAESSAARFGLRLRVGDGEQTEVAYIMQEKHEATSPQRNEETKATKDVNGILTVDRSRSGGTVAAFAAVQQVPVAARGGVLELLVVLDRCTLEVFADGGAVVVSNQIFPSASSTGLELFAEGGDVLVETLRVTLSPARAHASASTSSANA